MAGAASSVLMWHWPVWICRLPRKGRHAWACHFVPVTFDLGDITLTLEILWQLLYPTYLYYIGQWICGLPISGRCARPYIFAPIAFDHKAMTLKLEILEENVSHDAHGSLPSRGGWGGGVSYPSNDTFSYFTSTTVYCYTTAWCLSKLGIIARTHAASSY